MTSDQIKRAIGTLPSRQSAEQAPKELKETGFPMNKISVITENEIHRAETVLRHRDIQERRIYDASDNDAGH